MLLRNGAQEGQQSATIHSFVIIWSVQIQQYYTVGVFGILSPQRWVSVWICGCNPKPSNCFQSCYILFPSVLDFPPTQYTRFHQHGSLLVILLRVACSTNTSNENLAPRQHQSTCREAKAEILTQLIRDTRALMHEQPTDQQPLCQQPRHITKPTCPVWHPTHTLPGLASYSCESKKSTY